MLIKFSDHGTGDAEDAANYLLSDCNHMGKERKLVKVLRGDPHLVAMLANSLAFKHKYTSGVVAWAPEDEPTAEQKEEVLYLFEKVAWAGLDPARCTWSAVEHGDEGGGVHIHIFAARVDLQTGKSLNIAPPGRKVTSGIRTLGSAKIFNPICNYFNEKYDWASPSDPERARIVQLGSGGLTKKQKRLLQAGIKFEPDPRQLITDFLLSYIKSGFINDRAGIIQALKETGIEVALERQEHITIVHPDSGNRIRLKGVIYRDDWNGQIGADVGSKARNRSEKNRGGNGKSAKELREQIQDLYRRRAVYNQRYYGKDAGRVAAKVGNPDDFRHPDIDRRLRRILGDDAVPGVTYHRPVQANRSPKAADTESKAGVGTVKGRNCWDKPDQHRKRAVPGASARNEGRRKLDDRQIPGNKDH
jgi:hypothetical protein